jgi:hypothetical protein
MKKRWFDKDTSIQELDEIYAELDDITRLYSGKLKSILDDKATNYRQLAYHKELSQTASVYSNLIKTKVDIISQINKLVGHEEGGDDIKKLYEELTRSITTPFLNFDVDDVEQKSEKKEIQK